jgi:Leucine-rich repeat (LRR) protein
MVSVRKLHIGHNLLTKIDFLTNLVQLEELSLDRNSYIDDFSVLKKLSSLRTLNLSSTSFNKLELILPAAASMTDLDLSSCLINSYKGIENLKKLRTLSVSNLKASDVNYIRQLKQLKYLTVSLTEKNLTDQLKKDLPNTKVEITNYDYTR